MIHTTAVIKITGMHCKACQKVIERKLVKIPDVLQVKAMLSGEVTIIASRSINADEIKLALEGTDYKIG